MKTIYATVITLFLTLTSYAQTYEFAPVGAIWRYIAEDVDINGNTTRYVFTVQVIKDTIIEGKLSKKLNDGRRLYQNSNDSIFIYVDGQGFKLLYDLAKNTGETFISEYCGEAEVSVESVSSMNINGGDRKVQEYYANSLGCPFYGDVVEGIGYLDGYLIPSGDFMTTYWLQCYEDPFIGSFSFNGDACGVLNVEEETNVFSVFPTLFDDYIILESSYLTSNAKIILFNSIGECVYVSDCNKKIDTSKIPKGLYMLNIRDEKTNDILFKQKLIKP
ncbi:MAG: T9SS type A sorting domain-containing protein [Bacteroidia bacterium]